MKRRLKLMAIISILIFTGIFYLIPHPAVATGDELESLNEKDCWEYGYQAIEARQYLKAKEYLDRIVYLRQKAGGNIKDGWLDFLVDGLDERLACKDTVPEYTQKVLVIVTKQLKLEVPFPEAFGKDEFEKEILTNAKTDKQKTTLKNSFSYDYLTKRYVMNRNTGEADKNCIMDVLLLADYSKSGEKMIRYREVTGEQIKELRRNYAIMRLMVESYSKGKLSLDIHEIIMENAVTRVLTYSEWLVPDFSSLTPFPSDLLFKEMKDADVIAWHYPSTVDGYWWGLGGIRQYSIVPYLLDGPGRGFIFSAVTNPFGNLFHEYLHTVEQASGFRILHMTTGEMKKREPGWKPHQGFPDDFEFGKWHLARLIPAKIETQSVRGDASGWKMFSFSSRYPMLISSKVFKAAMDTAARVPFDNLRKSRDLYKRALSLRESGKFNESASLFREALDEDPDFQQAMKELGFCCMSLKDYDAADSYFREYTRNNVPLGDCFIIGQGFYDNGQYEKAVYFFKEGYGRSGNPAYFRWIGDSYTRLDRTAEAKEFYDKLSSLVPVNRKAWRIISCDSEETAGEDGRAKNAIDGNIWSYWHTEWKSSNPSHPHEIVIDMGEVHDLTGFSYQCRQNSPNGNIRDYEFFVSRDGSFGEPLQRGTFESGKIENIVIINKKVKCRYIKLRAMSEENGNPWTSAAEINVFSE